MNITKLINDFKSNNTELIINRSIKVERGIPAYKDINNMRYPLARYAQDNDVFIKITRPKDSNNAGQHSYDITVRDKRNPKQVLTENIPEASPDKTYTIEKTNLYLSSEGELYDIQHTHECNYISYIFSRIERLVRQIRG